MAPVQREIESIKNLQRRILAMDKKGMGTGTGIALVLALLLLLLLARMASDSDSSLHKLYCRIPFVTSCAENYEETTGGTTTTGAGSGSAGSSSTGGSSGAALDYSLVYFTEEKTKPGIDVNLKYFGKVKSSPRTAGTSITKIVLHHTASASVQTDINTWSGNGGITSAHYDIDTDGTIYYVIDESRRANHAGCYEDSTKCPSQQTCYLCKTKPPLATNSNSIGIEIVNLGLQDSPLFTQAQYDSLSRLLRDIEGRWGIAHTNDNIVAHCQILKGNVDPSPKFDWAKIGLEDHTKCAWYA
jgi:N-acetyl-anhydromuramyl-L-alanine amidase AmpD